MLLCVIHIYEEEEYIFFKFQHLQYILVGHNNTDLLK